VIIIPPYIGAGNIVPPICAVDYHFSIAEASNQQKIRISILKYHCFADVLIFNQSKVNSGYEWIQDKLNLSLKQGIEYCLSIRRYNHEHKL